MTSQLARPRPPSSVEPQVALVPSSATLARVATIGPPVGTRLAGRAVREAGAGHVHRRAAGVAALATTAADRARAEDGEEPVAAVEGVGRQRRWNALLVTGSWSTSSSRRDRRCRCCRRRSRSGPRRCCRRGTSNTAARRSCRRAWRSRRRRGRRRACAASRRWSSDSCCRRRWSAGPERAGAVGEEADHVGAAGVAAEVGAPEIALPSALSLVMKAA